MKKYRIAKFLFAFIIVVSIAATQSCTDENEYLKYAENGEILYTGKMDSVKVFSGRNRVLIEGNLSGDPKITSYKIYWADKSDSVVFSVSKVRDNDKISQIIENLPENIYNFEIRTMDSDGFSSVPVFATGKVYGDRYQNALINRPILESKAIDNVAILKFASVDATSGIFQSEIEYLNNNNELQTAIVPISQTDVILPDFKAGDTVKYRSAFKPDSTSLDVFYTNYQTFKPTPPLLLNNIMPFEISDNSGLRYSTAANWIHNAGALSHHGNTYGMVDSNGNNYFMNVVSGYGGEPDIINGLMYQTATIDPGTSIFKVQTTAGNFNLEDKVYALAALGNTLPNVVDVESSENTLAYKRITQAVGATQNYLYTMIFTVEEVTEVSVGLAITNDPGTQKYMPITEFLWEKQ